MPISLLPVTVRMPAVPRSPPNCRGLIVGISVVLMLPYPVIGTNGEGKVEQRLKTGRQGRQDTLQSLRLPLVRLAAAREWCSGHQASAMAEIPILHPAGISSDSGHYGRVASNPGKGHDGASNPKRFPAERAAQARPQSFAQSRRTGNLLQCLSERQWQLPRI